MSATSASASVTRNADVTLDVTDEYQRRATMHRPTCMRCMEREARTLLQRGLTHADIGAALGISALAAGQLLEREATTP